MDPDEFDAYLESLSPAERDKAIYDFGFQQANYAPPGFQGAFGPELTQQQYDLGQYTQAPLSLDDGEVEPYSLDVARDVQYYQKNLADLVADPMANVQAGAGGFDPGAFQPITVPIGEPLDLAGSRYVNAMAASEGGGYEAFLAQKIKEGATPGDAVAQMWELINQPDSPEVPQEARDVRDALVRSLPPSATSATDPATGMPSYQENLGDFSTPQGQAATTDPTAIMTTANDLFTKMTEDPVAGYTDPNTGLQYAGSYEQPSELSQKFSELGLPNPYESYLDPKWLAPGPGEEYVQQRQANLDAAQGRVNQAQDIVEQMQTTLPELQAAWDESRQRPAPPTMPEVTMPEADPEALARSADVAASVAGPHGAGFSWGGGFVPPPAMDAPSPQEQRMDIYEAEARKEMAPGTPGAPLAYGTVDGETDYDKLVKTEAQRKYDAQRKKVDEAGTQNPYVIRHGDEVVGAYDFGGSKKEQEAMAKLMGIVAYGKAGGGDTSGWSVNPYDEGFLQSYQSGIPDAIQQRDDAQRYYDETYQYQSPEESTWASSVGRAMAMQDMGRTPMEDALMQRAMGRTLTSPYGY